MTSFLVNDTVCLMLTVPVLAVLRRTGLPAVPYLIALAMSANIGSVATVVGNPQNMLIASYGEWSYAGFFVWMAPVGMASKARSPSSFRSTLAVTKMSSLLRPKRSM